MRELHSEEPGSALDDQGHSGSYDQLHGLATDLCRIILSSILVYIYILYFFIYVFIVVLQLCYSYTTAILSIVLLYTIVVSIYHNCKYVVVFLILGEV